MGAFLAPIPYHMFRTYDYKCNKCKTVFELMLKADEAPICECGITNLERLMSAPLFELKGNGWPGKEFKAQSECKRMDNGQKI